MTDTAVIFSIIGRDLSGPAIDKAGSNFNKLALGMAASAAFFASKAVNAAGDFQFAMTRVQTGAGEAAENIKGDMDGIMKMMGEVGESSKDLASALYLVNSAGYHGAEGLEVLKIAAMGAKVGAAELPTTADALTTALNAWHMGAGGAAMAMNALIAAEGQGKTNLEALASSLSTVAPIAARANISLVEVMGAMSTMTMQGTPAALAATYLKQAIGALSGPTRAAQKVMEALGIDSVKLGQTLSNQGLAAALKMVSDAIKQHMGPAGTVLLDKLKKMNTETGDYEKILANLPPTQQTVIQAMAKMLGGVKSMQAGLQLTGDNAAVFANNTAIIAEKVKAGGSEIEGWDAVQKNFNQTMDETKATLESVKLRIGMGLLPVVHDMLKGVQASVNWLAKHTTVAKTAGAVIGALAASFILYRTYVTAAAFATKAWTIATAAWSAVTKVATAVQAAFDLVMAMSPWGLVIAGIVLIVAGFVMLWRSSAGFRNFWIGLWNHIWSFMKMIGSWFAGPFARFFVTLGKEIAKPFVWLWQNVIHPIVNLIVGYFKFLFRIYSSIFHLIVDIAVMYVGPALMRFYNSFVKPVIDSFVAYLKWLWSIYVWIGQQIINISVWIYQHALLPLWHGVEAFAHGVASVFMWLWHNGIEPAVNGITWLALWVWNNGLKPAWDLIVTGTLWLSEKMGAIFGAIARFVSNAFSDAVSVAKWAINGLINIVNGAIGGIDTVLEKANKLPGVNFPLIPKIPHLAQGGIVKVGENGTEIVRLPSGSAVYPHGSVPADMVGNGGSAREVKFSGNLDSAFATAFARLVRQGLIQIT